MAQKFSMGWTPSLPDFRDKKYSAPLGATYPLWSDLSAGVGSPLLPTASQGELGACGAFALAKTILWLSMKDGDIPSVPSFLFIYWIARYLMNTTNSDSGVQNRLLMKAAKQFGWADDSRWPYIVSKFKDKPPQDVFEQAATRNKDFAYVAVSQDLNSLKGCLVARPFVLGFSCYSSLFTDKVAKTGIVPMPSMSESLEGGHDVTAIGYQNTGSDMPGVEPGKVWPNNTIKCLNHWYVAPGVPHGDGGFIYLPFAYVTNPNLAGDFWTPTNDGYVNPLHPPVPDPQPLPPIDPPAPKPPVPPWCRVAISLANKAIRVAETYLDQGCDMNAKLSIPDILAWVKDIAAVASAHGTAAKLDAALAGCAHLADLTPTDLDDNLVAFVQNNAGLKASIVSIIDGIFGGNMAHASLESHVQSMATTYGLDWTKLLPLIKTVIDIIGMFR